MSQPLNSARSNGRYRAVGGGRDVDESLFNVDSKSARSSKAVIGSPAPSNATFISKSELDRIKVAPRSSLPAPWHPLKFK